MNWRVWHFKDAEAKRQLTQLISEAAEEFSVSILAYVVMSNHFHTVVKSPPEATYRRLTSRRTAGRHFRPWPIGHQNSSVISQFMRKVRRQTSRRRHADLELSGRFWEKSYHARRLGSPWGLVVRVAYDHRNPVRAGIAPRPEDYEWSSAASWLTSAESRIPLEDLGLD